VARGEQLFAAGEYLGNHAASHWRDLIQWAPKAFYALSDQGLFASSNFVLNVLLARWLTPEEYGGFALAFSVFLLLAMAHSALLVEPALIFGPGRYGTRQRWYLHRLVLGHAAVTTGTAVLLCMATFVAWTIGLPTTTAVSLGSLFLASPFILFLGLMRRACYMSSNSRSLQWAPLPDPGPGGGACASNRQRVEPGVGLRCSGSVQRAQRRLACAPVGRTSQDCRRGAFR
jgi:hypothetical protein